MRTSIVIASCATALLFSTAARANDFDLGGCFLGPSDSLHRCYVSGAPAVGMAGVAAPILVIGAAATIAHELKKSQTGELPPGTTTGSNNKPSLSYVPPVEQDPYRNQEHSTQPSPAFKLNDTATNVATAVTAAAVVGAIIATTASAAKKH
jgi:hypothetical protein